jgi:hypothetical protein
MAEDAEYWKMKYMEAQEAVEYMKLHRDSRLLEAERLIGKIGALCLKYIASHRSAPAPVEEPKP